MGSAEPSSARWWTLDPERLERERRLLDRPWRLSERPDGRMGWTGGAVGGHPAQGLRPPRRTVELIYPSGFPARFIEARLMPDPQPRTWGMLGSHVNVDGSACYIAGEGWWPQLTARDALELLEVWWFNFWIVIERAVGELVTWPTRGRLTVPEALRAALNRR
jgi:hypothetical protein